jgi:hypothetical protein
MNASAISTYLRSAWKNVSTLVAMLFVRCAQRLPPPTESYDHSHSTSGSKIGSNSTNNLVLGPDDEKNLWNANSAGSSLSRAPRNWRDPNTSTGDDEHHHPPPRRCCSPEYAELERWYWDDRFGP